MVSFAGERRAVQEYGFVSDPNSDYHLREYNDFILTYSRFVFGTQSSSN